MDNIINTKNPSLRLENLKVGKASTLKLLLPDVVQTASNVRVIIGNGSGYSTYNATWDNTNKYWVCIVSAGQFPVDKVKQSYEIAYSIDSKDYWDGRGHIEVVPAVVDGITPAPSPYMYSVRSVNGVEPIDASGAIRIPSITTHSVDPSVTTDFIDGDVWFNATSGKVFVCASVGGSLTWVASSSGSVNTVNNISPVNGNITLGASDVGALPLTGGSVTGNVSIEGNLTFMGARSILYAGDAHISRVAAASYVSTGGWIWYGGYFTDNNKRINIPEKNGTFAVTDDIDSAIAPINSSITTIGSSITEINSSITSIRSSMTAIGTVAANALPKDDVVAPSSYALAGKAASAAGTFSFVNSAVATRLRPADVRAGSGITVVASAGGNFVEISATGGGGGGSVNSVCDVSPDENGNVDLLGDDDFVTDNTISTLDNISSRYGTYQNFWAAANAGGVNPETGIFNITATMGMTIDGGSQRLFYLNAFDDPYEFELDDLYYYISFDETGFYFDDNDGNEVFVEYATTEAESYPYTVTLGEHTVNFFALFSALPQMHYANRLIGGMAAMDEERTLKNGMISAFEFASGTLNINFEVKPNYVENNNSLRYCELLVLGVSADNAVTIQLPSGNYEFAAGADTTKAGDNHFIFAEYYDSTNNKYGWLVTRVSRTAQVIS